MPHPTSTQTIHHDSSEIWHDCQTRRAVDLQGFALQQKDRLTLMFWGLARRLVGDETWISLPAVAENGNVAVPLHYTDSNKH